ncbi:MAG: OmpA family protein, partial [Pseudomonadales bacterium]|nr:OmpA family protein [Pseudomonadales bacterium]
WEVIIGKRLSEKWFAELKYVDQGEAGLESSNAVLNDAYPDANIAYRTTSLMLGHYFRNSDRRMNVYAKVGIASINNDDYDNGDPPTVQFNEVTSEQLAFGTGVEYRFKNRARWFVRLNADFYDQDAFMASLSLNRFIGGNTTRRTAAPAVVTAIAAPPPAVAPPSLVPEPYGEPLQPAVVPEPVSAQVAADCGKFDAVVEGVNFETDSARLTEDSRYRLLSYARTLADYPSTVILVSAHTDWIGSAQYNQSLSERRAKSVVTYLIQSGVNPTQLLSAGYGESRPIASNKTVDGRAQNRRVELTIIESPDCGR